MIRFVEFDLICWLVRLFSLWNNGLWLGTSPLRSRTPFHNCFSNCSIPSALPFLFFAPAKRESRRELFEKGNGRGNGDEFDGPRRHNQQPETIDEINEWKGSKPFNSISIPFLNKNKINLLFWFRQFMKTKLNEMAELK